MKKRRKNAGTESKQQMNRPLDGIQYNTQTSFQEEGGAW